MKSIQEYNKHYDITRLVGKEITAAELQVLMAEGRVFTTRRHMYEWEANEIMGPAPEGYPYSMEGYYSGSIVTNKASDWEEAKQIAIERSWGEEVDGILCDIIAYDAPTGLYDINPQ